MRVFGWTVLALVFLDELLAVWAAWIWGGSVSRGVQVVAPVVVVAVWFLFASPRSRFGGPVVRPVVKVLVFGLTSAGLWAAGHHGWALAFLVFSVGINLLALVPGVQELASDDVVAR